MLTLEKLLLQLDQMQINKPNIFICPIAQSHRLILAQDIIAPFDMPANNLSMIDGYAMNESQINEYNKNYKISSYIQPGFEKIDLINNTVARIYTGGTLPNGSDSLIMQEDAKFDKENNWVSFTQLPSKNMIRRKASSFTQGELLLKKDTLINSWNVGLLASLGLKTVEVYQPLKIGILANGVEFNLDDSKQSTNPNKIYDANSPMLMSTLEQMNFKVEFIGLIEDDYQLLMSKLEQKVNHYDVIISTGGASVGDYDFIHRAIEELGSIHTYKILLKPGKPLIFGSIKNCYFFGLPGNPVSAFITFQLVVKHFLKRLQGMNTSSIHIQNLTKQANFKLKAQTRKTYLPSTLINNQINLLKNIDSGNLYSLSKADGLAVVNIDQTVEIGNEIEFISLSNL